MCQVHLGVQMGAFNILDPIDKTLFVVRYARCDEDPSYDTCFRHPVSEKLQEKLEWLQRIVLVQRDSATVIPKGVLPDDYGNIKVKHKTYDATGRLIDADYKNACSMSKVHGKHVCLFVHASNWKVMMETTNQPLYLTFDALWRVSDGVVSGPQDVWIAKKNDPFLGHISYRNRILRDAATSQQKFKAVQAACRSILETRVI